MFLTANPAIHREWYRAKIGENAYNRLEHIHSKPAHYTLNDLQLLLDHYRKEGARIKKEVGYVG